MYTSGVTFSLPGYYKQYIACLAAIDQFSLLDAEQKSVITWQANKTDIIECFIGKFHWYSKHGFCLFADIQKYPRMVTWLQDDPQYHTERQNKKLWGYHQAKYEWSDLEEWKMEQEAKENGDSVDGTMPASKSPS